MELQRKMDKLRKQYEKLSSAKAVLMILIFIVVFSSLVFLLDGVPTFVLVIIFIGMIFLAAFLSSKISLQNHKYFKFMGENVVKPAIAISDIPITAYQVPIIENDYVRTVVLGVSEEKASVKLTFNLNGEEASLYAEEYADRHNRGQYHDVCYYHYQVALVLKNKNQNMKGLIRFYWIKDVATGNISFSNVYASKVDKDPRLDEYVNKLFEIVSKEDYDKIYIDYTNEYVTVGIIENDDKHKGHLTLSPVRKDGDKIDVMQDYFRNDLIFANEYIKLIYDMYNNGII